MTENEAKTKHCCGPEGTGSKGPPDNDGTCDRYCIGSACMAWRVKRLPDGDQYGFCGLVGLAGKP